MTISAADPLNLTGILTSGDRVRALTSSRIVYRDGVALAVLEGDRLRHLMELEPSALHEVTLGLVGTRAGATASGLLRH